MKIISQYVALFILLISNLVFLSQLPTPVEITSGQDYSSKDFEFIAPDNSSEAGGSPEVIFKSNPYHKSHLDSVVKLSYLTPVKTPDGRIVGFNLRSSATGFSISYNKKTNESYIVTNNHFCDDAIEYGGLVIAQKGDQIRVEDPDVDPMEAQPIYVSKDHDLCLVDVKGYVRPARLAQEDYQIKQLEQVVIIGAPRGLFPILMESNIAALIQRDYSIIRSLGMAPDGEPFLLLSARIEPGHSGSPVFNNHGEVIGVLFAGFVGNYGAIAIPLSDVRNFLNEAGLEV